MAQTKTQSTNPLPLAYESALTSPSEMDHEFNIAWAKSLRRRFLWYCGVIVFLTIPELAGILFLLCLPIELFNPRWVFTVLWMMLLSLVLYTGAWWYAYRSRPNRQMILALAFWLYVTASIISLSVSRFQPSPEPRTSGLTAASEAATMPQGRMTFLEGIRQGMKASSRTTRAGKPPSQAQAFAVAAPIGIFINHLFLCLFLPWSFRQSIRPAMVILGFATGISLLDLAFGQTGRVSLLTPMMVMMAFVPGSVWCWWRFSRFRRRFKLYYESSAYQQLQKELTSARRIHEAQLPAMRTQGPLQMHYAYEPMRQIGGDLLFAYPPAGTPADKLSAVVFDVTGHGVAAALFVNRLVGELERCFGENPSAGPGDVLTAINSHVFYTLAKHSMYVTAIAVQINLNGNSLIYANGGHPDAFLSRGGGGVQRLASTTYMLGVIEPASFTAEQATMRFDNGDAVVLYTDGAMEARNAESGLALGIAGLEAMLEGIRKSHCGDWPQALLEAVAAYRQSPAEDDTLIVALCRE
jgi:hypothetical protein